MTAYRGQCHCGATGYDYHCDVPVSDWPVRACQCRFCRDHGAQTTSMPEASIEFVANAPDRFQRYRFGLQTADFLLCCRCGVYLGAVIETSAGRFGIVNTCALDPRPTELPAPAPARYDGEDLASRIARRERRWARVRAVP